MRHQNFTTRFPEFENTDPSLIEMALGEARNEINPKYFGDTFELVVQYLAAHKLAISPMGEPCRLAASPEKTTYQLEYERLCKSAYLGAQVI
ncbi:MAG: DUF4054 domain-containing protein [Minisyncoccia bacterium]